MMQTSFDANLVRAERSDVGVAISLALCDREKLSRLLVSQNFLHISKAVIFVHLMIQAI